MTTNKFHHFEQSINNIKLPQKFTYPFHYTPHPLCVLAAGQVQAYLQDQTQWHDELQEGKMFGVLIVRNESGEIGFLSAFSGNLANSNQHEYFVPPVYDLLKPDGFFRLEEDKITEINHQVSEIQNSKEYKEALHVLAEKQNSVKASLLEGKDFLKREKERRNKIRLDTISKEKEAELIRESQFQKAEFKRQEKKWKEELSVLEQQVNTFKERILCLKQERKRRSAALQLRLFKQFEMLNALGEKKDLCEIFEPTAQQIPPAGAGECAAPKLLQFAFCNHLKPLAMAEFWWGNSPKTEIRLHGYYYPACKAKCEPILKHMLIGLDVEDKPLVSDPNKNIDPEILYEDKFILVINKPYGILSVPGKGDTISVYDWMKQKYPDATGPLIVHRLDMATSGLLVLAKTKEAHQNLQAQFKNRTIKKRYIAKLDGVIHSDSGNITLPICPNPSDRPRQMVSEIYGKPAITEYQVLKRDENTTLIAFYPITGRTHQLRVHAAHPDGLNAPIIGDELYGKKSDRLYLHAEYLEFDHPISGERLSFEKEAGFE